MGVYIWNRLPSEYQEVEWIQSSGTQYINTGYEPNNNTEVECKINMASITNTWDSIYGATNTSSGASKRAFLLQIQKSTSKMYATIYSNYGSYQISISSASGISTNTDYTIKQSNTNFYIDGVSQGTYSSSSYTVGYNMNIFSYNEGGTSTSGVSMKLYYTKIWDSGTLVRNLIPCYRKSDSVIGLYDLVNNQFYTNSGTGTFTKGNDVNTYREKVMKNAYIGEVWTPGSNTMLYLPFSDDLNDHSSNQTSTKGGTVSITTLDGVNCANFNSGYLTFPSKKWFNTNWTVSLFVKTPNNTTSGTSSIFLTSGVGGAGTEYTLLWNVIDSPYYINSSTYGSSRNNYVRYGYTKPSGWTHIVATQQGLTGKLYVNGTLVATNSSFSDNNITANTLYIGNNTDAPTESKWWLKAYLSNLIIENTVRDATKVAHYFDITKSNYGL